MTYRNKTYIAFASENIRDYRLMEAWKENKNIEFNFYDAHDLYVALDTSQPETIRRRLRERLNNSKQAIVLVSEALKNKAGKPSSFIYYEIETIKSLNIPIVFVNLNQSRLNENEKLPPQLLEIYSVSVSFQPKIIKYALDEYCENFESNKYVKAPKKGPHYYPSSVYQEIGL